MLRRHEGSLRVMFERYSDGAAPAAAGGEAGGAEGTMSFDEWKVPHAHTTRIPCHG